MTITKKIPHWNTKHKFIQTSQKEDKLRKKVWLASSSPVQCFYLLLHLFCDWLVTNPLATGML